MTINLTDPSNHPANSPLTGERIERVIEALEGSLKYRNGSSMDHFIADAVKGLRELLEVRKAKGEPVALEEMTACKAYDLLMEKGGVMSPVDSFVCAWNSCRAAMVHDNRRYLSQPVDLQVAEYEEIMDQAIPDNSFTNDELEAMAHGNNPQANAYRELLAFRRNSTVTPDGWIPVSERMPLQLSDEDVDGVDVIVTDGILVGTCECRRGYLPHPWVEWSNYGDIDAKNITHWKPLPAAPKEAGDE